MNPESADEGAGADVGIVPALGPDRTMEQVVARQLRKLIIEGALSPGARLRYRDLAGQFDVSVTPVRIAVRELATDGLVEIRAHGGARVSRLSRADLEEVYATRIGIEIWLARVGAPQVAADTLRKMDLAFADAQAGVADYDRERFLAAAWSCRRFCYEAAGRPRLFETAQILFDRSARYHRLTLNVALRLQESLAFLERFRNASEANDGLGAARAVQDALERSAEFIIDHLSSSDAQFIDMSH